MRKLLWVAAVFLCFGGFAQAADDIPPGMYAFQTNTGSASVDTVTPGWYCHITNIPGAADDHPPGAYCHETNAGNTTDDVPPGIYLHVTNPGGSADGTVPGSYFHVTNFVSGSPKGLIPDGNSADCLQATPTACLLIGN